MGLSHLVATGDETSPDPIAVAREGTLWGSWTLVGRTAADRVEPRKKPRQNSKNATLDTSRLERDFLYPE
ncbi:hypothetical protein [Rothia sp. HMSC064D08]|uniref:hypothetical protein n=1 Tax=Rothia sp. HMSC064D08 TaxID=1715104 RepID=UPI00114CF1B1|nr:hypothetical protein [Rothia sp. HMSC064D08]